MRLGLGLPRTPGLARPDAVRRVAVHAEAVGFDSLWADDRLLSSIEHAERTAFLDPIGALHVAAASTTTLALGAAIVAPWHPAVVLGRALTTLDLASEGRLTVALTTGCSLDEYDAAGIPVAGRTGRLDETLDVLDAAWRGSVVAYEGDRVRIAPSSIEPKPAQHPRPPILLGGTRPDALDRVARRGDGWLAAFPSVDVGSGWETVRALAADHGRDPDGLELVVHLDLGGISRGRADGAMLARGVQSAIEAGAHELVVGFPGGRGDADGVARIDSVVEELDGLLGGAWGSAVRAY
jgi:probable F420-dependent oxidoreductase